MRSYLLFDLTGLIYLLLGFLALRMIWALGEGPEAWKTALGSFDHPLYIAFHLLSLISVVFVGVRFFRLFPKAQPAFTGALKPPSRTVILGGLYALWALVTVVFSSILAGGLF
jgi:fumarate reductase subunit C